MTGKCNCNGSELENLQNVVIELIISRLPFFFHLDYLMLVPQVSNLEFFFSFSFVFFSLIVHLVIVFVCYLCSGLLEIRMIIAFIEAYQVLF